MRKRDFFLGDVLNVLYRERIFEDDERSCGNTTLIRFMLRVEDPIYDDDFQNELFVTLLEEYCSDELRRQLGKENRIALADDFFKRWSEVAVGVLRNDFPETWIREQDLRNESYFSDGSIGTLMYISTALDIDFSQSDLFKTIVMFLN